MTEFLADTYALVAHYNGSKRYKPYFESGRVGTTGFNLLEFASYLLRAGGAEESDLPETLMPWRQLLVDPAHDILADAASFRHSMRKSRRNCSFVDAWGYAASRSHRVPFLTGDDAFKGVPHVEFVKE